MRILVLGGTAWLGSEIVRAALAAGHEVTCAARGGGISDGAALVQLDRDNDDALAPLASQSWDAVIDLATEPGYVRRAVRDLSGVGRYVFISTASVYQDLAGIGVDETAPTHPPLAADVMADFSEYGPAKVACEEAVRSLGEGRWAIVRPGLIGGPGDTSGRTTYWPLRFARPSSSSNRVLVPDAPDQPTSVIEVRDLAAFAVHLAEGHANGVFNAVGTSVPLGEHLATAREVAGTVTELVPASPEWLIEKGVNQWAGPRSLPLWLHDEAVVGLGAISNAKALAAGLSLRPLVETLRDTLTWALANEIPTAGKSGITDQEEQELLQALATSSDQ